jgi:ribosomal protein S18 acetylase RimI-like enzyme
MIKRIEESELQVCLEVIHRSFKTVADEFGLTSKNCPTNGAFMPLTRLRDDYKENKLMYGLYSDNKMIGYMQLSNKGDRLFELEKLSVLPDHRHKGYGMKLLDYSKAEAADHLGIAIKIGIIDNNLKLKNWYIENGFVYTGEGIYPHLPFKVGFMTFKII